MKQVKRILSLFLSLAMVVTGVNLGTLLPVKAAEIKDPKYIETITGKLERSDTSSNDITLATANSTTSREGSRYQAPYILGETAGAEIPGCNSNRYGCLVFELPENLDHIYAATVSFFVRGANNADHANYWTKAALYQTANGEVTASDESTYRAINEDYSAQAAMWSDKKVTKLQSNANEAQGIIIAGELKFDVEKAVRAAIEQKSRRLVLRLQTVRGGIMFDTEQPITLTLDTSIPTTATVKYVDADGKEIQNSKTVDVFVDSDYTYDVLDEEMKITSAVNKYYLYDDENSDKHIEKIKQVVSGDDSTQNIITLKYNEITVAEQSGTLEVELCAGDVSGLPDSTDAVFSDESISAAAIEWDAQYQDPAKYQEIGAAVEITGKFKGTNVPVNATVKVVANLEQLNESFAAWYPLDADAKDASGNGIDGEEAETVVFDRDNGATFNGGKELENCIILPKEALDDLKVTDQMTFSFWTKFPQASNLFGIGSVIANANNQGGGASKHFYMDSSLNVFMTDNGWADGAHKGFEGVSVSKNEWHYITAVLDGKKLTLYIDKEKKGTEDTDISMTEAWNYNDGANRYMYIGNCAYAHNHNNDHDFKGSIKDFRIYNAALTQPQIAQAYNYVDDVLPMKYAKDDILRTMTGVNADYDGNLVITNVTTKDTDNKITLPTISYGNAAVTWEVTHDAISSLVSGENAVTGTVAIPDENEAEGKLTATITLGDKKETVEYNCSVFRVNADIEVTAMEELLDSVQNLREDNYTAKTWAPFAAALAEAKKQARKPTDQTEFNDAKSGLETAKGNLVNIAALKARIAALRNELQEMSDTDKERYTKPSRDALDEKLSTAEQKMAADSTATQDDIDTTLADLPAKAVNALALRGDKTALNNLVTEAEAIKANKADYKEDNWEAFEAALGTAKDQQEEDLSQAEVNAAENALKDAMAKLEPTDAQKVDKTELANKIKDVDAEAGSLTRKHYTPETWTAYQEAIAELKAIQNKPYATAKDVDKAVAAVAEAYAGLRPTEEQKPTEQEKTDLKNTSTAESEKAKGMNKANYTKNSWEKYQAAVDAMAKVAANIDSATTTKIKAVTDELNAAKAALVDKSKLDKAIKDYEGLKKENYTAPTWTEYENALNKAKTVSADPSATKKDVEDALTELNAKRGALADAVTDVKVNKITVTANYTKLAPGKKANLTAKVEPGTATNKTVKWSVDKNAEKGKYASIKNGVLTTKSKAAGKTIIVTAAATDGSGKSNTIKIKVMKGGVKKISLKAKAKKVKVKKKLAIKATVTTTTKKKSDANTKLTWKSSNTKVATVNSKGQVTGKKAGKVTITATSTDGTKKSAKVKITVVK